MRSRRIRSRPEGDADRPLAARDARDRQHRSRGGRKDDRADPTRRPAESRGRDAAARGPRAACGELAARARGYRRRSARSSAADSVARGSWARPARDPAVAAPDGDFDRRGGVGRDRGRDGRDDHSRGSRRPDEHDQGAQRSRATAAPPSVADRGVGTASGVAAARRAPDRTTHETHRAHLASASRSP